MVLKSLKLDPWHVLLDYFATREFIKNLFDTFLIDGLVIE